MFDIELVLSILNQLETAIERISYRFKDIITPDDFTCTPEGMEKLDSICMLFIAIGESLKKIDKITDNKLLSKYSEVNWRGVKGFRDIIAHQYFDIDAEEIFWICSNETQNLQITLKKIISDLNG